MATLSLSEKQAKEMYPSAASDIKTILEETFGKKTFLKKITDRVKSFTDACAVLDISPAMDKFYNGDADSNAYEKLKVIIRALNEGWTPDWDNTSQRKWAPWFYFNKPGFRFDGSDYFFTFAFSYCGSRLCFATEELSDYAAKQFLDIYKDYLA